MHFRYPVGRRGVARVAGVGGACSTPRAGRAGAARGVVPVAAGRTVALVGPSGAGKTTITGLVSRLYDVTAGAVRVGGADVRDVTLASLHEAVGVVTQDAHMFHDTVRANLLYAKPEATDEELRAACRAAQILDLVDSPARRARHGRRATAGTGSPAGRSSAWRSPGCC